MPIRFISAGLIFFLGLLAAQNSLGPMPTAQELGAHRTPGASIGSIYGTSQLICEIDSPDVCESSGLVRSARDSRLFWTHNDSGGAPAIVAFDREGKIHGVVQIEGAVNRDWEEITSFRHGGAPWLILADCGNNFLEDRLITLYFLREPSPAAGKVLFDFKLDVRFESGVRNCESVVVDPIENKILFVSKVVSGRCEVFEAPMPEIKESGNRELSREIVVAKRIAAPEISLATGMCISVDGRRLVIVNYQRGFEYCRAEGESWQTVFSRPPKRIDLTWRMPQRESVCFDEDDRSLLMTSEARRGLLNSLSGSRQSNTIPLWRVPAKPAARIHSP